jgi:hypothetical protein
VKDERLAEMREALDREIPTDPANLLQHTKLVRMHLTEALDEMRAQEEKAGGDFGRALRGMLESRIQEENHAGRELPPGVEVVSMSVHFTAESPVVDVRMKLVPVEDIRG